MSCENHEPDEQWKRGVLSTHVNTITSYTVNSSSTLFALEQAIRTIKAEIAADTPFAKANDTRRAEIDQLTDMIDRRR